MVRRHRVTGVLELQISLPDRREFRRRFLAEAPFGGLLVDVQSDLAEEELVELNLRFEASGERHRLRGVILWARRNEGRRQVGIGFLPIDSELRESLLGTTAVGEEEQDDIRKQPRYSALWRVTYQRWSRPVTDEIRNISKDGIFIATSDPPPLGSHFLFKLVPPDKDPVYLPGKVTWLSPGEGFGVRFVHKKHVDRERFDILVREMSHEADLRDQRDLLHWANG